MATQKPRMPRPRQFAENDLLDSALRIFWQQGYAPTTMARIVDATGVNRASLYASYPDKQHLFLAVVRRYIDTVHRAGEAVLAEDAPAAGNIRRFFARLTSPENGTPPGCLLHRASTDTPAIDAEIGNAIRNAYARLENALTEAVARAAEEGMLADACDPAGFAAELLVLAQGLRLMAQAGLPRETLERAVFSALKPLR